ncbi:MAG: DUF3108 domain-containing protein [Pseudolabrys sp.]
MTATTALYCRAAAIILRVAACLMTLAVADAAQAQSRLRAHYTISMTGVSVGQIVWLISIGDQRYTTSASGKASGVLSVLVNGEGAVDVRGVIVDGRPQPKFYTSNITDDEGKSELRVTFDDGVAKETPAHEPPKAPPSSDRIPVTEADRRGVADPLSAMLIPTDLGPLGPAYCDRVLSIFDGRRRYDLILSFKRFDKIALEKSYSGPVLVCGVVLKPIAGYRADSLLVKYVGGRRDMELWFVPIGDTPFIAPVRVSMPTLVGTLEILADQFEFIPNSAPPVPRQ